MKLWIAILLFAVPLCAQRAQLARKGRQPERGVVTPGQPLRKLPRRKPPAAASTAVKALPAPMSRRSLADDRLRPLLRGAVESIATPQAGDLPHLLFRPMVLRVTPVREVPIVAASTVSTRWKFFP